ALLLYQHLNRSQEAAADLEQAIAVLEKTGLPQNAVGHKVDDLIRILQSMRTGASTETQEGAPPTMSEAQIQLIITSTVAVMTTVQDRHDEWREVMMKVLQDAQQQGAN